MQTPAAPAQVFEIHVLKGWKYNFFTTLILFIILLTMSNTWRQDSPKKDSLWMNKVFPTCVSMQLVESLSRWPNAVWSNFHKEIGTTRGQSRQTNIYECWYPHRIIRIQRNKTNAVPPLSAAGNPGIKDFLSSGSRPYFGHCILLIWSATERTPSLRLMFAECNGNHRLRQLLGAMGLIQELNCFEGSK